MGHGSCNKKHIILVHGACHGAWSWHKVTTQLRSAGYQVTVPDLAASGVDERRFQDLRSFIHYSQPLLDILACLPPGERVILVGHSLGGLNIALAMDRFPEKIAAAVFVTALMPDSVNPPSYVVDKVLLIEFRCTCQTCSYNFIDWRAFLYSLKRKKPCYFGATHNLAWSGTKIKVPFPCYWAPNSYPSFTHVAHPRYVCMHNHSSSASHATVRAEQQL